MTQVNGFSASLRNEYQLATSDRESKLPFTSEQFFQVFAAYNLAVWPAQPVACMLGAVMVVLTFRAGTNSSRIVAGLLAAMWLWTGLVYQLGFFYRINPAAPVFAAAFAVQAALFVFFGSVRHQLIFAIRRGIAAVLGTFLVTYAAILYPVLGFWMGHSYPGVPTFGITPCPLTIFTFGLLLLTAHPVPKPILVIPFLWSLIGGSAAVLLDVPQDWMLMLSGPLAGGLLLVRDHCSRLAGDASDRKGLPMCGIRKVRKS